jgi:molecular chaperone GrpE
MEDLEIQQEDEQAVADLNEVVVDPLVELKAELATAKDQYLRARAEIENVRKRGIEDAAKAKKFAIESFAENLIPVADSLYAALETDQSEGLKMTLQQLVSAFEKGKLFEIKPEVGDAFDPHKHQAIATVESDQPVNTIVSVLQRGYTIVDRVVRPAMVTVSKAKEETINVEQSNATQDGENTPGSIESNTTEGNA